MARAAGPEVPGLFDADDEIAELKEALSAVHAERSALNDRYMILLKERSTWEKSVRSAAGRAAWRQVASKFELYVTSRVTESYTRLCGRIEMLPDPPSRPKADQLQRLKEAGRDVMRELREASEATAQPIVGQLAEMTRLREVVRVEGAKLHATFGPTFDIAANPNGICECAGCALILAMDQTGVADEPTGAGS